MGHCQCHGLVTWLRTSWKKRQFHPVPSFNLRGIVQAGHFHRQDSQWPLYDLCCPPFGRRHGCSRGVAQPREAVTNSCIQSYPSVPESIFVGLIHWGGKCRVSASAEVTTSTASVLSFLVFWLVLGEKMKQREVLGQKFLDFMRSFVVGKILNDWI